MDPTAVVYLVRDAARYDPVRAWELWTQFKAKERLDDIAVTTALIAGMMVFVLLALITIISRI